MTTSLRLHYQDSGSKGMISAISSEKDREHPRDHPIQRELKMNVPDINKYF